MQPMLDRRVLWCYYVCSAAQRHRVAVALKTTKVCPDICKYDRIWRPNNLWVHTGVQAPREFGFCRVIATKNQTFPKNSLNEFGGKSAVCFMALIRKKAPVPPAQKKKKAEGEEEGQTSRNMFPISHGNYTNESRAASLLWFDV